MQPPLHLMKQTATIGERAASTEASGAPQWGDTYAGATVQCSAQPASSDEAMRMQRDFGETAWDLYCAPTMSDGTSTVGAFTFEKTLQIGGVTFRCLGDAMDDCSEGAVVHVVVGKLRGA